MSQSLVLQLYYRLSESQMAAGLVFLAFGFNMVDCGGLLGGRLGNNSVALKKIKAAHSVPVAKRTFTL